MVIDSVDLKNALSRRIDEYQKEAEAETNPLTASWYRGVSNTLMELTLSICEAEEAAKKRDPSKGVVRGY